MRVILAVLGVGLAGVSGAAWEALPPMPSAVSGVKQPVLLLDGDWKFTATGVKTTCAVPGEWAMQGITVPKGEAAVYERGVTVPADWAGLRGLLRFDGVHAECEVFWDEVKVGEHAGGFVPFIVEVPKLAAGEHVLRVEVKSESVSDTLSTMSQYAAHQVGGIVRSVRLMCVPKVSVESLRFVTEAVGDDWAEVAVHVRVPAVASNGVQVTAELVARDGSRVWQATAEVPEGKDIAVLRGRANGVALWTSETPELYKLAWQVKESDGATWSRGDKKVGLRTVKVEGNRLLVNGRPVKLFGVNRHEIDAKRGRCVSPELARKDAKLFKGANVNCVRTSHYPPSEAFLDACDELGLFVECEAALCWVGFSANPIWKEWDYKDAKFLPYLLRANLDQVAAFGDHASVIMWSLGNESNWSPLWSEVDAAVRAADPSRPTVFHDQAWGDGWVIHPMAAVANQHYPYEDNPEQWSKQGRPLWFGEYAHVECYNRRELLTDPGIRADWGRPLERMVDLMWAQPGCLGGTIWAGIDDVFEMPDGSRKGYGEWGIIDVQRRKKPEYDGVRSAYSPVKLIVPKQSEDGVLTVKIQNRFNFTNLKKINIDFSYSTTPFEKDYTTNCIVDLEPHAWGEIKLPLQLGISSNGVLAVRISDSNKARSEDRVYTFGRPFILDLDDERVQELVSPITYNADASLNMLGKTLPAPVPFIAALNNTGGAATPSGTQLSADIEPLNDLQPWTWKAVDGLPCVFTGENEQMRAQMRYGVSNGVLDVSYRLEIKQAVNPRQWGLLLTAENLSKRLMWVRNRQGRICDLSDGQRWYGSAYASYKNALGGVERRDGYSSDWNIQGHALGSVNFRATRTHVFAMSLGASPGEDGTIDTLNIAAPTMGTSIPAVRAWVDGDCVRILCAGFSTGGADHFMARHYDAERRPLKMGDVVKGGFRVARMFADGE